ncbi:hypothetical protein [Kitasatospora sp. GP82]|uniref:hypothetical protein n=1 Tax=Kitasatospora sp. GP82 TaxID=3035089 RepID=UPI002474CD3D|nr:hypothetical protein [Kitasatospora sp. GP82]MDH6126327.1 hypothetical protein [Kitasatospora sp. GP82]
MGASSEGRKGGHDQTALDEIELAGELMIAATASPEERLAPERIDQVLLDGDPGCPDGPDRPSGHRPSG